MPPTDRPAALRVLVADDNRDAADSLAQLLELALGCQVRTAYDGEQALSAALAQPFDAIILDIDMPGASGIEVARRLRQALPGRPPLLVVLTGKAGVSDDLDDIDACFDHTFAKPVDFERLSAVLTRPLQAPPPPGPFDAEELFTDVVRAVVPSLSARRLPFGFNCRGPALLVEADPAAFRAGLQRLADAVAPLLDSGFTLFTSDVEPVDNGLYDLEVTCAGTGTLTAPSVLAAVLERLGLAAQSPPVGAPMGSAAAAGVCPHTGATIAFACFPTEGALFRWRLRLHAAERADGELPDAAGARAWLIDADAMGSASLHRRLQRLGWAVTRLESCGEALAQLHGPASRASLPALVVVNEADETTAGRARELAPRLGPAAHVVLSVQSDSPTLRSQRAAAGLDLRVQPLSPLELLAITRMLRDPGEPRSGNTIPAPLSWQDRPQVLIVDDNEVNRIVARGLLEALGYEVATATDGLDAIEQCRRAPPQTVLMDVEMPVLGGIAATRRLRELQAGGAIATFAIVAATADPTPETRDECLAAGMDGCLHKPLKLSQLSAELRRVASIRSARGTPAAAR